MLMMGFQRWPSSGHSGLLHIVLNRLKVQPWICSNVINERCGPQVTGAVALLSLRYLCSLVRFLHFLVDCPLSAVVWSDEPGQHRPCINRRYSCYLVTNIYYFNYSLYSLRSDVISTYNQYCGQAGVCDPVVGDPVEVLAEHGAQDPEHLHHHPCRYSGHSVSWPGRRRWAGRWRCPPTPGRWSPQQTRTPAASSQSWRS